MNFTIQHRTTKNDSKIVNYNCPMFDMDIWKSYFGKLSPKPEQILVCFKTGFTPIAVHISRRNAAHALREFRKHRKLCKA
jgi:hypothetical protein